ncbi:MAG: hypothetical protein HZB80_04175 [Deltaproteobacteria bacterium]|nr:hypothetical protein [Deltaproteobacteria bacterium]
MRQGSFPKEPTHRTECLRAAISARGIAKEALKEMHRQVGDLAIDKRGIAQTTSVSSLNLIFL